MKTLLELIKAMVEEIDLSLIEEIGDISLMLESVLENTINPDVEGVYKYIAYEGSSNLYIGFEQIENNCHYLMFYLSDKDSKNFRPVFSCNLFVEESRQEKSVDFEIDVTAESGSVFSGMNVDQKKEFTSDFVCIYIRTVMFKHYLKICVGNRKMHRADEKRMKH